MERIESTVPAENGGTNALASERLLRIEKAARRLAKRSGLSRFDEDDYVSDVLLKCVVKSEEVFAPREDAVKKSYQRRILANALHDFRRRTVGHWRNSRRSRERDVAAMVYERLRVRDGLDRRDCLALVAERCGEGGRAQAEAFAREFPSHPRRQLVPLPVEDARHELPTRTGESPLGELLSGERTSALRVALRCLSESDAQLLRLVYWEGQRISEIARRWNKTSNNLYRKRDAALRKLRVELRGQGM